MLRDFDPLDSIMKQLEDLESDFPDLVVKENQFTMGEVIGKGGFGEVYKAFDNVRKIECAYKRIFTERLEGNRMRRYIAEIKTMAMCDNMFLVPIVGFTAEAPYCIVTEFMPHGSLDKYIRKRHSNDVCPFSGSQLTSIAIGIAHGMMHLHKQGIIHRDLKAANIVLDKRYFPRICDFGIARFGDEGGMTQKIGTPNYMAPELIISNSYDNKVDVYAYAMILYEMAEGIRAFKGLKLNEIFNCVVKNQERPDFTDCTPQSLKNLISRCWDQDPKERPSFEEVFNIFKEHKASFPNSKPRDINKFIKAIEDDEKKRGPIRDRREKELKERQLARENGQKVKPLKRPERLHLSSDNGYDYDKDDAIVVNNSELSPIGRPKEKVVYDMSNLKNINSPDFDRNLNYFANTIQPKDIGTFVQKLSPHLIEKKPVSSVRLIIQTILSLMSRDQIFVQEIMKTNFFQLLPVQKDVFIDDCYECYKVLFTQYQKYLNDIHIPYIADLIKKRPKNMLCLFSSYVTSDIDRNWSIIGLLFQLNNLVIDTRDGIYLLSIFYYLMDMYPSFAQEKRLSVLSIFSNFLKSKDPGNVIVAINGLIHFNGEINTEDIPYITRYLHDGLLWQHALRYLSSDDFTTHSIKVNEELIRALIYRSNESKLAVLVLLRLASTKSGSDALLRYPQWMILSKDHPTKAFQIFGVLFKNKENRDKIIIAEQFPHFLKNLILNGDDFYVAAIPSILKRSFNTINTNFAKRVVKLMTKSGFLRAYVDRVVRQNVPQSYTHLLITTDILARIDFSEEYLRIAQALMSVMSNPTLFGQCLNVFYLLAFYKECAKLFFNSGILEYVEPYKKFPEYKLAVTRFLEKVRSS